jgi:hypothetical protein
VVAVNEFAGGRLRNYWHGTRVIEQRSITLCLPCRNSDDWPNIMFPADVYQQGMIQQRLPRSKCSSSSGIGRDVDCC